MFSYFTLMMSMTEREQMMQKSMENSKNCAFLKQLKLNRIRQQISKIIIKLWLGTSMRMKLEVLYTSEMKKQVKQPA